VVIGFQAVLFSVLGKVFAWQEGLIPAGERFRRLFEHVTLEVGLAVGLVVLLAGAAGSIYAFVRWTEVSFGPLDVSRALRIAIPSLTAVLLGGQIVLASFFLSLLGIPRHHPQPPSPPAADALAREGLD
jgi:hypothetical protein